MASDWFNRPKPTGLASDSDREDVPLWMIDGDDLDADDFFDDEDEDDDDEDEDLDDDDEQGYLDDDDLDDVDD